MNEFSLLAGLKRSVLRNRMVTFFSDSKFKAVVVAIFGLIFWAGLFFLIHLGLSFLEQFPDFADQLVRVVMELLFLSLILMLCFSNGIISYLSFFKSRETRYLTNSPLSSGSIYLYKLTEVLTFSSWAFLFLAAPLVVAYGLFADAPLYYYPMTFLAMAILVLLPAAVGSVVAIVIARWFPSRRRNILILLVILGATIIIGGIAFLTYLTPDTDAFTRVWLRDTLNQLSFASHPLLPSAWVASGMIEFGRGQLMEGVFYTLELLANGLMALLFGFYFSEYSLGMAWKRAAESGGGSSPGRHDLAKDLVEFIVILLPAKVREFVRKDLISFFRDPAQWSQFLIFFGLLAVYFVNLRELNYHVKREWWRLVISLLNLGATGLTLASFTSRFIYPQISLEGRRFWVVGIAPVPRKTIIFSKFIYSLLFTVTASLPLIMLSVYMLNLSRLYVVVQVMAIASICLGLSGLAVGIGTLYPDMTRDDPSKIVSGFGGTLNLVLSLFYVIVILLLSTVPVYIQKVYQVSEFHARLVYGGGLLLGLLLTGIASVLPLYLAIKAMDHIET